MTRNLKRKVFDSILNFEKWFFEEKEPSEWEEIDWTFILEKLIEVFPNAESRIFLSDRLYHICSKQDILDFLALDQTDQERYETEFFDCDDFSFRLMGQFHVKPYASLAFGIAWSRTHAYNVAVTKEGVYVIEPQTDSVFLLGKEELYEAVLIII